MSNLLTLTQDEIDRWELKGKVPGDTITASEYSKVQKEFEAKREAGEKPSKEDSAPAKSKK